MRLHHQLYLLNFSHACVLQALLTDMAAHSNVIEDINKMADEMISANHGKMPAVKKRQAEINDKYDFAYALL